MQPSSSSSNKNDAEDWVGATRKRLREHEEAKAKEEAAEREAQKVLLAQRKVEFREAKRKGAEWLKAAIEWLHATVRTHIPLLEPQEICLVELRSTHFTISLARLDEVTPDSSRTMTRVLYNTIRSKVENLSIPPVPAHCALPEDYRRTCLHEVCAQAYRTGLQYREEESHSDNACSFPWAGRSYTWALSEERPRHVVGLRVPLDLDE